MQNAVYKMSAILFDLNVLTGLEPKVGHAALHKSLHLR